MDIYDSRYFNTNKRLLLCSGLWPYGNKNKNHLIQFCFYIILSCMALPQICGMRKYFSENLILFLENTSALMFNIGIISKLLAMTLAERKLQIMCEDIKSNWETITEKNERAALIKFSERGRTLVVIYLSYMICVLILFICIPITPLILNKIKPLNKSRPLLFILNGVFPIKREDNIGKIYMFDLITICVSSLIGVAVDTMYVVCTQHCIGLFAIIRYRLQIPNKIVQTPNSKLNNESYNWMIDTIKLHNKSFKLSNTIESVYSKNFLSLIVLHVLFSCTMFNGILDHLKVPVHCIRYGLLFLGNIIHLFYIIWPGQKLMDYSTHLFTDVYCMEWYESTSQFKQLLRFFALRCSRPCMLTAGGMVNINFETFYLILYKSISYLAVFLSCREKSRV